VTGRSGGDGRDLPAGYKANTKKDKICSEKKMLVYEIISS